MRHSGLRSIPAVEKVLLALGETGLPRSAVVAITRRKLAALRKLKTIPDFESVVTLVRSALDELDATRIRPLINGTGILVHTNLGRSPLGTVVTETLSKIGSHYSNLEYSLKHGSRGGRGAYLEHNLALLCGAEAATVVNNNAAALVLILHHFCRSAVKIEQQKPWPKNEVVISRGELVQIGGGFRIPEILESSGARLCEVGTTNKTSLADYSRGITSQTALILKVHRSNFFMGGFVALPPTRDIATLSRKKHVPFVEDLGSGAIIETQAIPGVEHEPTPADVLRQGVDLVCFSGDKLFGGPQAGIVAGNAKRIAALKREPLFRALRCDKLILGALEMVVDCYLRARDAASTQSKLPIAGKHHLNSERLWSEIPVLAMMRMSNDDLRLRAEKIIMSLAGLPLKATVGIGRAQIGGGSLPRSVISSVTVDLAHDTLKPQQLAACLREKQPPVVGYVARDKFKLDLRTVFPEQDPQLVSAIRALSGSNG